MLLSKKLKYICILFFISLLIVLFVLHTDKIRNQKKQPDIVLVVLDTVRRDYTFLEKKNITPNLKQFADEGTIFYRAWSNAPWTVPSHASIFTGLLPTEHGCTTKNFFLNKKFKTIAEILNKKGYETAGFYSNPWLSMRATGLMRGFQKHWESHIGGLGRMTRGRGDQGGILTNKRIRDWIKKRKRDRPFFLFVNYYYSIY